MIVAEELHRLEIHLIDGAVSRMKFPSGRVHRVLDEGNFRTSMLDAFQALKGARKVKVTGVGEEYGMDLEGRMTARRRALPA